MQIIYEDKDILVAYKPAGLATQTARVGQQDMVSELKNYLASQERGKAPYLGVIHRLDQPVEGLLVFAKNKNSAAIMTKQLAGGTLHKQYYAVVCGQAFSKEGELVDYLCKTADNCAQVVKSEDVKEKEAKKAVLQYHILDEKAFDVVENSKRTEMDRQPSADGQESADTGSKILGLADVHIDTGRFHQIRVQMSHAGMPLLGDNKYGNEEVQNISNALGVRTVALCAYSLELRHPVTGKQLSFRVAPQGKAFSLFEIHFDTK